MEERRSSTFEIDSKSFFQPAKSLDPEKERHWLNATTNYENAAVDDAWLAEFNEELMLSHLGGERDQRVSHARVQMHRRRWFTQFYDLGVDARLKYVIEHAGSGKDQATEDKIEYPNPQLFITAMRFYETQLPDADDLLEVLTAYPQLVSYGPEKLKSLYNIVEQESGFTFAEALWLAPEYLTNSRPATLAKRLARDIETIRARADTKQPRKRDRRAVFTDSPPATDVAAPSRIVDYGDTERPTESIIAEIARRCGLAEGDLESLQELPLEDLEKIVHFLENLPPGQPSPSATYLGRMAARMLREEG